MAGKYYIDISLQEHPEIFRGYYENMALNTDTLEKLSKDIGIKYEFYDAVNILNPGAADSLVLSMSKKFKIDNICFLIEDDSIIGYSIEESKYHILNEDFMNRVSSLVEFEKDYEIVEQYYTSQDSLASILIKRKTPFNVEITKISGELVSHPYEIGVLIVNDELNNTYCRLVVFIEGKPVYLPASFYNATNTRFRRSTQNATEALEVLVLKVKEDLMSDVFRDKMQDIHRRYNISKSLLISFEEYTSLLRCMKKIPTIIDEDYASLSELLADYETFEKRYAHIEEQKSSYIWRCTAKSEYTVGSIIISALNILAEVKAPVLEYMSIRELLGSYMSTPRIIEEIAQEDN